MNYARRFEVEAPATLAIPDLNNRTVPFVPINAPSHSEACSVARPSSSLLLVLTLCLSPLRLIHAQSPVPDDFNPGVGGTVYAMAVQPDGKVIVGGYFSSLGGQPRANIGRLNEDGTLDTTFNPGANGTVYSLAVQTDGKLLVGGDFSFLGGEPHRAIGRLDPNGTVDSAFNPEIGGFFPSVRSLIVQADGKILMGGDFTTIAGQPHRSIGRVNLDGTIDSTLVDLNLEGSVSSLALHWDGGVIAGGQFSLLVPDEDGDLIAYFNLIRFDLNGTLDDNFYPDPDGDVACLAVQPDGRVLVSGGFATLAGLPRERIARINGNGDVDTTFSPATDGEISSIALQTDGKILLGGAFSTLSGQPRNNLGRLNANGTLDNTFTTGVNGSAESLAVQSSGKILVGGDFSAVDGHQRSSVARLNNTASATHSLSYAGSTITWLRGDTSPEVWRTTFEYSSDGLGWINLGAGTRFLGGWQKPGVVLPAGSTIRARGYVAGGYRNGSGWIVEAIRGKPVFSTQPVGRANDLGTTATFAALAVGNEPLSYQWLKNGVALLNQGNIAGVNSSLLTLSAVSKADEGGFRLVVSNSFGSVTSVVATLTVRDPYIIQQPTGTTRNLGESATFSVVASGSPPLGYQWYREGIALSGAVGTSLLLQNLASSNAGFYTVVVTNAQGSITSAPALLAVNVVTADSTFNPGAVGFVDALAVQTDGKVLVSGDFSTLGGQPRSRLGRLNPDGTLDSAFNPGANSDVYALALQTDGKILVGGEFTTLGGQSRNRIARLNANGTLDVTFNPGANDIVGTVVVQTDGKILVGGSFTTLAGQPRNRIGRLNADGSLDASFNPGASGDIYSLALQVDGKILVGGEFTTLGGQPRDFIGRLNANGTLDATFNPGADGPAWTLAVQADGKILTGGFFFSLGGQARDFIGRLNPNGTLDAAFNPGADGEVFCLAVQADGQILVGGTFLILGGQARNRLGRLNTNGTLDGIFNPGANGHVFCLALQPDGKILAGGGFTTVGGQARSRVARLNNTEPATQSLGYAGSTATWLRSGTGPEFWRTTFESSTNGLAWSNLGDGTRIAGGWQKTGVALPANATLRARGHVAGDQYGAGWFVESFFGKLMLLSQPASRTNNFGTTATFAVRAGGTEPLSYQWQKDGVALLNQGNTNGASSPTLILNQVSKSDVGGFRLVVSNSFGSVTSAVATLTVIEPIITQHSVGTNSNQGESVTFTVTAIGTPPLSYQWYRDGIIVTGAVGSSLVLQSVSNIDAGIYTVRVSNAQGSVTSAPAMLTVNSAILDSTFDPGANNAVYSQAVQADGKILVGGAFTALSGQARNCIGRLNEDGTLDINFNPGATSPVFALAVQGDGKNLAGGNFTTLAGQTRNYVARLDEDGTLDSTFNPGANSYVTAFVVQADGKILVGGWFTTLAGQTRNRIARLNEDGTLDSTFDPGASSVVNSMAVQADGKILVGGYFTSLAGQTRNRIARLNENGTLDSTFNPGASSSVDSLAVQADGKILVGGSFTSLSGQFRNYVGRLNENGTLDSTYSPGANSSVYSLAVQADGKVLVGGSFSTLAGSTRNNIGRLNNTDPATQSLSHEGSTITWLRGGTSPEVWRTTFEHFINGSTWTNLGVGTRTPGGWQLTGVALPANATVRARGFVSGGYYNGSGWFVESVIGPSLPILLSLERTGATVTLSWTGGPGLFQVQQTTNLDTPIFWQDVGGPVPANSMSLPIGPGSLFLRVRGQ